MLHKVVVMAQGLQWPWRFLGYGRLLGDSCFFRTKLRTPHSNLNPPPAQTSNFGMKTNINLISNYLQTNGEMIDYIYINFRKNNNTKIETGISDPLFCKTSNF